MAAYTCGSPRVLSTTLHPLSERQVKAAPPALSRMLRSVLQWNSMDHFPIDAGLSPVTFKDQGDGVPARLWCHWENCLIAPNDWFETS